MLQHGTVFVVALGYAAIAFKSGGYSTQLIAAGAIAIWWVVMVGILARWWRGGQAVPREAIVAGVLLAALAAWTALSMLWALDAGRSFTEVVRVGSYLGLFALMVLVAGTVGPRPLLTGLAIGLTVVAAAALGSRFFPGFLGTSDQAIFSVLVSAAGRLSYPIGYWNGLAACMAGLVVLLVWFGAAAAIAMRRALAVALIPVPLLVIYLTSSRGGFAAALVGVLIVVLLAPRKRARMLGGAVLGCLAGGGLILLASRRPDLVDGLDTDAARTAGWEMTAALVGVGVALGGVRYAIESRLDGLRVPRPGWKLATGACIVALIGIVVVVNPVERVEEFAAVPSDQPQAETAGDVLRGSGSGRYQYWSAAVDAFADKPLTGIGAGNYELWWNTHGTLERKVVDAHSLYIETLGELGLVGALILAGFLATLVVALRRALRRGISSEVAAAAALVGCGLLSAGLDWTWEIPAAFSLVIVGAAIVTGTPGPRVRAVEDGEAPGASPEPPRRDGFALGVATIAAAWACVWVAGVLLITDVKLDDSREAAGRGDLQAAAQDARDAGTVQPWSPEPPLQEAQVELLRHNIDAARAAAQTAVDRAPDDWRTSLVLARVEYAAGNTDAYRSALADAQRLAPLPLPVQNGAPP
jgi:hypothetical protein